MSLTRRLIRYLDGSGNPIAGLQARFYQFGTQTELPVYADLTGDTELQQPVTQDGDGLIAVAGIGRADVRLEMPDGSLVKTLEGFDFSQEIPTWTSELAAAGVFSANAPLAVGSNGRLYFLHGDAGVNPVTVAGNSEWRQLSHIVPVWQEADVGGTVPYSIGTPFVSRGGDLYVLRDNASAAADPLTSDGWVNLTAPRGDSINLLIPEVNRSNTNALTDQWVTVHTVNIERFREIESICVLFAYVHTDTARAISVRFISESAVAAVENTEINGATRLSNGTKSRSIPLSDGASSDGEFESVVSVTDRSTLTVPIAALPQGTEVGDIVAQRGSGARAEIVSINEANDVYAIRLRRLGDSIRPAGTREELNTRYGLGLEAGDLAQTFSPPLFRIDQLDALFREAKYNDTSTAYGLTNYATQRNSTVLHNLDAALLFAEAPEDALSAPLRIQMRTDGGMSPLRITGGQVSYRR